MSSSAKLYILAVVLFFVGLGLGLVVNKVSFLNKVANITQNKQEDGLLKLLSSRTAVIRGKVIKVEGKLLTVQNSSGVTGDVLLWDKVLVSKAGKNGAFASPSASLSAIELNQDAIINLVYIDGGYQVISVQILSPLPPSPKLQATKSATPNR